MTNCEIILCCYGLVPYIIYLHCTYSFTVLFFISKRDLLQAIVDIAKKLSWTYVIGLHSGDTYARQGMQLLQTLAKEERICFPLIKDLSSFVDDERMMRDFVDLDLKNTLNEKTNGALGTGKQAKNMIEYSLYEET